MSYTIGFIPRNQLEISAAEAATANQALAMIAALREAGEIKFIRSPQEGEMGIEMLLLLAKEETEEMPQAMTRSARPGRFSQNHATRG
jgi:hypothetical protein